MYYPSKGSTYQDLINGAAVSEISQYKLKKISEQIKSLFSTKTDLGITI